MKTGSSNNVHTKKLATANDMSGDGRTMRRRELINYVQKLNWNMWEGYTGTHDANLQYNIQHKNSQHNIQHKDTQHNIQQHNVQQHMLLTVWHTSKLFTFHKDVC